MAKKYESVEEKLCDLIDSLSMKEAWVIFKIFFSFRSIERNLVKSELESEELPHDFDVYQHTG